MLRIRAATAADADTAAEVYLRSRAGAGDAIPPGVHPPDDVRRHVAEDLLPTAEVWLAEDVGEDGSVGVLGMGVIEGDDLDMLYVLPEAWGRGVGGALLAHAQDRRPDGLALWVFASNLPARRFYERRGFRAVRSTDGDNEEGAPDVRYVWGAHAEGCVEPSAGTSPT